MQENDAYSIADIARRLCVSERHVHRLISRQELPSVLIGRRRLVLRKAFLKWLDALDSQIA